MVVALIALVIAVGGVTYGAIPSEDGSIHGCVNTSTGTLRVYDPATIGAGRPCTPSEQPLNWNDGVRPDSIRGEHINAQTFEAGDIAPVEVPFSDQKFFRIADNALQGEEVQDETLTGADIDERTLPAPDTASASKGRCDPTRSSGEIICAQINFGLGRAMPVLLIFTWGWSTHNEDRFVRGICRVLHNKSQVAAVPMVLEELDDFVGGATPIVLVHHLQAGAHNYQLRCKQDSKGDIELVDMRINAVELASDGLGS